MLKKNYLMSLSVLAAILFSCAPVPQNKSIADYRKDLIDLAAKIKANPADAEAYRDLGIICINTEQYPRAEAFLKKSYTIDPGDNKTMFYYGFSISPLSGRLQVISLSKINGKSL